MDIDIDIDTYRLKACLYLHRVSITKRQKYFINLRFTALLHLFQSNIEIRKSKTNATKKHKRMRKKTQKKRKIRDY